jgi:hypothetical protein
MFNISFVHILIFILIGLLIFLLYLPELRESPRGSDDFTLRLFLPLLGSSFRFIHNDILFLLLSIFIPATLLLVLLVLLLILLLLLLLLILFVLPLPPAALLLVVLGLLMRRLELLHVVARLTQVGSPVATHIVVALSEPVIRKEPVLTALAAIGVSSWCLLRLLHHVDSKFLSDLVELLLCLQSGLFSNQLLLILTLFFEQLPLQPHSLMLLLQ